MLPRWLRGLQVAACCALTPALAPALQLQGKVWIGDGVKSHGTYDGATEAPFVQALTGHPGWQIEVLPGEYTFTNSVDVTASGVRIYGPRDAVLARETGLTPGPLFSVEASAADFALDGLTLEERRSDASGLVRILAPDARISGCAFRSTAVEATGTGSLLAFGDGEEPVEGGLVLGNSFLFHPADVHPVGIQAFGCRGLTVLANEFRPFEPAQGAQTVSAAIALEDSPDAAIRANLFTALASVGEDGALVSCASGTEGEGGGSVLSANVFGEVSGAAIVLLDGVDACTVSGNVFGRESSTDEVVLVAGGAGTAVTGNQFHGAGSNVGTAVRCLGTSVSSIGANTFLDCAGPQVDLVAVSGANVFGNRFRAQDLLITVPAIVVDVNSAAIVIGANAARGASFSSVYTAPSGIVTPFENLLP